MNPLWSYLWPVLVAGLFAGAVGGFVGFRRKRPMILVIAGLFTIAAAAGWHGPLGAADRFTARVEADARDALNDLEMPRITAHLRHGPLTRQLILAGSADDFQRGELARLLGELPGVHNVTWTNKTEWLPLIVEGIGTALAGFLVGALLAYLRELRRRYNAQWTW